MIVLCFQPIIHQFRSMRLPMVHTCTYLALACPLTLTEIVFLCLSSDLMGGQMNHLAGFH